MRTTDFTVYQISFTFVDLAGTLSRLSRVTGSLGSLGVSLGLSWDV